MASEAAVRAVCQLVVFVTKAHAAHARTHAGTLSEVASRRFAYLDFCRVVCRSSYFFVRAAVCVSCRVTHVSIFIESITAVSTLTVQCNMQRTITHGARFSSHLLARSAQHLGEHCVFVGAHGPHQVGCGVIIEAVTEHKVLE